MGSNPNAVQGAPPAVPHTLVAIDSIDSFAEVRAYPASMITAELVGAVRQLDEREELEPFLRSILTDVGDTPHGRSSTRPVKFYEEQFEAELLKSKAGIAVALSYPLIRLNQASQ